MIALVRDLVASNPATLPLIIGLLANANPAQQTAIGTGLGQAAGLCIRPDPAFAADIQSQLAGSTSDNAKNAYAAVTGNQPIRSVAVAYRAVQPEAHWDLPRLILALRHSAPTAQ
jgi:hypothetical protein